MASRGQTKIQTEAICNLCHHFMSKLNTYQEGERDSSAQLLSGHDKQHQSADGLLGILELVLTEYFNYIYNITYDTTTIICIFIYENTEQTYTQ